MGMTSNLHLLSRDQDDDPPTRQVHLCRAGHDVWAWRHTVGGAWLTRSSGTCWYVVSSDVSDSSSPTSYTRQFVTCWRHHVTLVTRDTVCQLAKHQQRSVQQAAAAQQPAGIRRPNYNCKPNAPMGTGLSSSSSLKFLEWPKQQRHHEDHFLCGISP